MTLTYDRAATMPNCRPIADLDAGYITLRRGGPATFETLYCVTDGCGFYKSRELKVTPRNSRIPFNDPRRCWKPCDAPPHKIAAHARRVFPSALLTMPERVPQLALFHGYHKVRSSSHHVYAAPAQCSRMLRRKFMSNEWQTVLQKPARSSRPRLLEHRG